MTSRRKRGPVAFRPRPSAGLAVHSNIVPQRCVILLSVVGISTYAREDRIFLHYGAFSRDGNVGFGLRSQSVDATPKL
jgi:hypothetical protein